MEGFAGANIDQLSIAVKVVVNQKEMAKKREKIYVFGEKGKYPGHGLQGGRQRD
jgi:hypothetical protein